MKRIGIVTSGGDSPGMNAAIRAVVRRGLSLDMEVVGIRRGYAGLISGDLMLLTPGAVGDIIHRGGTILRTARSAEFRTPEGQRAALEQAEKVGLEGLVVIGGDGTFRGADVLTRQGLPCIGIPGTIDNDICGTDSTLGFDTAVNTAVEAMRKLRDTATSHDRTFVVEVMGRDSGWLALASGLAGGAESILVPEYPVSMPEVCDRLRRGLDRGKRHSLIVVAEGVGSGFKVADEIKELVGLETRVTVLGHIQRGGCPTAADAMLAARLGARAVELLKEGTGAVMVGQIGMEVVATPLADVVSQRRPLPKDLVELAATLAI